jgi:hypothetical protein
LIGRDPQATLGVEGAVIGELNQPSALMAGFHRAPTSAMRGSPHLMKMSHVKVSAA